MKKFTFPLERIRDFRSRQAEAEEIELQRLLAERAEGAAAIARLDMERDLVGGVPEGETAHQAQDLAARDSYRDYLLGKRKGLLVRQGDCEHRIDAQTRVLLEARRKVKLLDGLRKRRLGEWTSEFERELEILAGELFLARRERETVTAARDQVRESRP